MTEESDHYSTLAGEIATSLGLEEMREIAASAFPGSEIRESSHYEGGRYIKVDLGEYDQLSFERCSDSEYIVRGETEAAAKLKQAAERLSAAFASHQISNRFEVYHAGELCGEFDHAWPPPDHETGEATDPKTRGTVALSQYSRLEDAQKDAARLAKRGIEVSIVHTGAGGIIAGTGTSVELRILADDLDKLSGFESEIAEEVVAERRYECPKCGSNDYEPWQPLEETLVGMLRVLLGRKPKGTDYLNLKCGNCACYFRIRIT
jgi:hypothetical protein